MLRHYLFLSKTAESRAITQEAGIGSAINVFVLCDGGKVPSVNGMCVGPTQAIILASVVDVSYANQQHRHVEAQHFQDSWLYSQNSEQVKR